MIRQILSDETMNRKGYITLNDGVNWDEYRKNPVLMLEHEDDKQPIGRIDNIRFEDNAWYGDLVFADTEEGREKEKLYNEGFYNAVSISGLATKVKREGVVYAVQFDVWADANATHQLRVRYGNGAATSAVRTVRVDGTSVGTLTLPSTGSWDSWGIASIGASLTPGRHTVRIEYDSGSAGGINLDNLVLAR